MQRDVIAVDLPGHGATPARSGALSITRLADDVGDFIVEHRLGRIETVGSAMGGQLVLELARRGGVVGSVVALDPTGFGRGWERHAYYGSLALSIRLQRMLARWLPRLAASALGRTLLLAGLSARPWRLSPGFVAGEVGDRVASPVFDELLRDLAYGDPQRGAPRGTLEHRMLIGWGRKDRRCLPRQARRAVAAFPDARLHWFAHAGHHPAWDTPEECARLILHGVPVGVPDASELLEHIGVGAPHLA